MRYHYTTPLLTMTSNK